MDAWILYAVQVFFIVAVAAPPVLVFIIAGEKCLCAEPTWKQ